ncbi:MAG: DUF4385 family protein [Rhodothermales bacterium]|nr:DUF4385 family protein [Rhodothermales bacterium]
MATDYAIDFRERPECYRYTPDERGVFKVQPYKDDLLPLWRFRDEPAARASASALRARYDVYRAAEDFVGMDMARKYLQMGFTRSMRYAKYPGGRKREPDGTPRQPQTWADPEKRAAALVFREAWKAVLDDPEYLRLKAAHQERYAASECRPMED